MRMTEKCRNNNSDNPLTSRRTDGGKNPTRLSRYIDCRSLPLERIDFKSLQPKNFSTTKSSNCAPGRSMRVLLQLLVHTICMRRRKVDIALFTLSSQTD